MKRLPPWRGLWSPWGRRSYALMRALPSAHVPGVSSRTLGSLWQVKYSAAVMGTSALLSIGHVPGVSRMNNWTLRHEYAVTSRMGTRLVPDLGHFPGLSSRTASSPGVGQTYESGGRSFFSAAAAASRTPYSVVKS